MKNLMKLGLLLLFANPLSAQDFPKGPVAPITKPLASGVILKEKTVYVIESDIEFFVVLGTTGKATVVYDTGPKKYKGEFPDAPGVIQSRTYAKKFLAEIDGVQSYKGLEIFTIPKGIDKDTAIKKVVVDVNFGIPEPDPDDPPTPATKTFWVVLVEESRQRTPAIAKIFGDKKYFDSLKPAGHDWYTTDQNTLIGQTYIAKAKKEGVSLPAIFLVDTKTEQAVTIKPMPPTTEDISKLIKQSGGK